MVYDPNAPVPTGHFIPSNGDHMLAMNIVSAATRDMRRHPDLSVGALWCLRDEWQRKGRNLQYQSRFGTLKDMADAHGLENIQPNIPFGMYERAHWLMHRDREHDLTRAGLTVIRIHALNNLPVLDHPDVRHLPDHRLAMMVDAISREPRYGQRGARTVDADQFALMVVAARLGASHRATGELLMGGVSNLLRSEAHRVMGHFYTVTDIAPQGWHWDEDRNDPKPRRGPATYRPS